MVAGVGRQRVRQRQQRVPRGAEVGRGNAPRRDGAQAAVRAAQRCDHFQRHLQGVTGSDPAPGSPRRRGMTICHGRHSAPT
jgi:hypothetical protein